MSRATKLMLTLFALLLSAASSRPAQANTVNAFSCKVSDVQAAINSAKNGDTVTIPNGSCTWTTGITIPSAIGITIQGSGTPNSTPATTGASASCSSTIITLNGPGSSPYLVAFKMTPNAGASTMRLSCMAINYGSGGSIAFTAAGTCNPLTCPNLRLDNVTFDNWAGHAFNNIGYGISAANNVFGVADHNTVNGARGNYLQLIELSHSGYLGVGQFGDNSWHQSENYGSSNYFFFENNQFNNAGCCENEGDVGGGLSTRGGAFVVVRFNTFVESDNFNFAMGWHGTESNGRARSTRAFEFYDNTWSCAPATACGQVAGARGGTGLFWGNSISLPGGSAYNSAFTLSTFRSSGNAGAASWLSACDGASPYDTNDGVTYYSGTIGSVSGSVITVGGTSPGWAMNRWAPTGANLGAPFSIHDTTSGTNGTEIIANGANTLTLIQNGVVGAYTPVVGHSFQILRATACIDQAGGRGASPVLYNNSDPATPASSSTEAVSPMYAWLNTYTKLPSFGTSQITTGGTTNRVIALRDWYAENLNQAAQSSTTFPFDGTKTTVCPTGLSTAACGIGHGTLANRPATCTTGVSYWATDQGNWNQSDSGGPGELFVCTATDTWNLYYTPYTYPHPLVAGGTTGTGGAPDPPTALRVVVQ
jgi:hypothetical protein